MSRWCRSERLIRRASKVSAHVCVAPVRASSPPGGGPRDRPAHSPDLPVRRGQGGAGRPRRRRARAGDGRGAARAAGRPAALAPGGGTRSRLGDRLRVPAVDRQPPVAGNHRRVHPQLPRRRPRAAVGATGAGPGPRQRRHHRLRRRARPRGPVDLRRVGHRIVAATALRPVLLPRGCPTAPRGRSRRGRVGLLQGAGPRRPVRDRGAVPVRPGPPQRAAGHGRVGGQLRDLRGDRRHRSDPASGGETPLRLARPWRGRPRRNVLPAMVASAASYVTFAAIDGTDPTLPVAGNPPFDWRDLGGAVAVGLLCGLGARLFSAAVHWFRDRRVTDIPMGLRIVAAGAALALLAYLSNAVADEPLSLGLGYDVIEWASDPGHAQWLVLTLLVLRVGAVLATLGGGGAGGLVVPLVVMGALTGRFASGAFGMADSDLLLVVGMASFLGAGYRTPLAAVMFVAETTGRPGFVVPALLATAASQLMVGDSSVSEHQRAGRLGHLERRFELPISAVLETDVRTVPPDATIEEFLTVHLVGYRQRAVAVVDDTNRYVGLAVLDEGVAIRRDAVQAMEAGNADVLAVVDGDDRFVGVVTTDEVLRLDEILERTNGT